MSGPLVSIIMNCYNGSEFLRRAIDSIYAQTYNSWEIIFWDNVSTDSSAKIAQGYNNKLKYFLTKKFTNLGEARELAVKQASGEYIAFLDCDDYWYKDKLELQMPLFQDSDVGLVYSNYWIKEKEKKKISSKDDLPSGYILNALLNSYSIGFLTTIVRRSVVSKKDPFFDIRYDIIHDFDLMIRISINCKTLCVQSPLACYCYHGNNETIQKSDRYIKELEAWIEENKFNNDICSERSFYKQQDVLSYLKGIELVNNGNKFLALSHFFKLSFCVEKVKLLLVIVLPRGITSLIKRSL
jgi:glycosyltransferase involved in cell wall biosynthesis